MLKTIETNEKILGREFLLQVPRGTWVTAQSVKYLEYKHKDPSLISRTLILKKKPGMVPSSTGRGRLAVSSLGLFGQSA